MPSLLRLDIFRKQTSLNLVIFGKNKGNFRKKDVLKNVKSQFVDGGVYLLRLISWIVLCCYGVCVLSHISHV